MLCGASGEVRFDVRCFTSLQEVVEAAAGKEIAILLLGLAFEGRTGLDALAELETMAPELPVITIEKPGTGLGLHSVRNGARDYFSETDLSLASLDKSIRCGIILHSRRVAAIQDRNLFENLLKNIPERIWFKDLEGRFIRVNQAMADGFKVSDPEAMSGKTDFDFFTREHSQPAFEDERLLIEERVPSIQKSEKETFSDGRIQWALTTKMPLRSAEGQIVGTFGISHDITKLRETEEALEQERNQLQAATSELRGKNSEMESSLVMAREIQLALLPRQYPKFPATASDRNSLLRFDHRYFPAQVVGGDFFSIFSVSPSKAGILICDVMGHGPSAALVTAIMRALCDELMSSYNDPGVLLRGLNLGLRRLLERIENPMFCTAFYMTVDTGDGSVRYANAGHPSPIHIERGKGRAFFLTDHDNRHGPVLGLTEEAEYPVCQFTLEPRDAILLFTDGLFEVSCEGSKEYGAERLLGHIGQHLNLGTAQILDSTLEEVTSKAKSGFDDDVCLVSVERA